MINVGENLKDKCDSTWNSTTFTEPELSNGGDVEDVLDKPVEQIAFYDRMLNYNMVTKLETHHLTCIGKVMKTAITTSESNVWTRYNTMCGELIRCIIVNQNLLGTTDSWIGSQNLHGDILEIGQFAGELIWQLAFIVTVI